MKKIFVFLLFITFLGAGMTSCGSSKSCPSYNNYDKYKKTVRQSQPNPTYNDYKSYKKSSRKSKPKPVYDNYEKYQREDAF